MKNKFLKSFQFNLNDKLKNCCKKYYYFPLHFLPFYFSSDTFDFLSFLLFLKLIVHPLGKL
uniref:Uncharacterized protein n=1 Tax=Meloidogyne enterolobii TaxID=390850 RepID=A0A6V7WNC6_MELEN|nr:unnamed protein product [Meloidogyne enterolobii]